jgi:YbbR domain-containing protein
VKKFLKALWKLFRSNLALKIVAVLFAIILWSYVLSNVNPLRDREIQNVPLTYSTENLNSGLAISKDLSNKPATVNIRVEVRQNDLKNLNNQNAQAYIDLSGINSPGSYIRNINAGTKYGDVVEVSPSQVSLRVDYNITRQVPVKVDATGSVPAGYYAYVPEITPNIISISGAETDVQKVVSARCTVNLNGLTEGFSKSSKSSFSMQPARLSIRESFPIRFHR